MTLLNPNPFLIFFKRVLGDRCIEYNLVYLGALTHHLRSWTSTIATSNWGKVYQNKCCQPVLTFEVATDVWMIAFLVTVVNVMWLRSHGVYLCFPPNLQFWLRRLLFFWAFLGVATLGALRRWWHCVVIFGHRLFNSKVLHRGDRSSDFVYNGSRVSVVFQGLWTWPRPSAFFSQDFFCGLSVIRALRRDDTVLQAFQITCPYGPVLNRAVPFQAEMEGWRSFQKNWTLLHIESIRSRCFHMEPSWQAFS